jgi:DNA polymerase I
MGDASDNVPGIAGVGPKTASSLLQKYRTLENLFKHIDEIEGSVKDKLKAGEEDALKAKRLVELDRKVDLQFTINDLHFDPNWDDVRGEYQRLGFKSIVVKIPGEGKVVLKPKPKKTQSQLELV